MHTFELKSFQESMYVNQSVVINKKIKPKVLNAVQININLNKNVQKILNK